MSDVPPTGPSAIIFEFGSVSEVLLCTEECNCQSGWKLTTQVLNAARCEGGKEVDHFHFHVETSTACLLLSFDTFLKTKLLSVKLVF